MRWLHPSQPSGYFTLAPRKRGGGENHRSGCEGLKGVGRDTESSPAGFSLQHHSPVQADLCACQSLDPQRLGSSGFPAPDPNRHTFYISNSD